MNNLRIIQNYKIIKYFNNNYKAQTINKFSINLSIKITNNIKEIKIKQKN